MLYFVPRIGATHQLLFDSEFAAGLLTPAPVGPDGRARFELAATEAADLTHDREGGVLVSVAYGVVLACTRDAETGALVVASPIPAEVVVTRRAEAGSWRDSPAPPPGSHLPRGLDWDPRREQYKALKAQQDAEREGVARG